jgi:hypothetical protein
MKGVIATPILAAILAAMLSGSGVVAAVAFFAVIAAELAVMSRMVRR